jgi:hypothetical protein
LIGNFFLDYKHMPVRKTESRIPANFQASDLGEAIVAADGRCAIISYVASPLVLGRENTYVLFVTDPALAGMAQAFEWSFTENEGTPERHTTQFGEISYSPKSVCNLNVIVRIQDAVNAELANLTLTQTVRLTNRELELTILLEQAKVGPSLGNLDVDRELVNDYSPYYQSVTLQSPEEGDAFQRIVFGLVRNGALQCPPALRKRHIEQLASSLNGDNYDFPNLITQGVGICAIRLALLAMTLPEAPGSANTFLKWTELPEVQVKRSSAETLLNQDCAGLDESKRLDLFNLLRFPKSNITLCGRIIETLRNRYFPGTNFNDVMTGMSGTRAQRIIKHFRLGPLQRG